MNKRRTPPILALRPALYALACVFGVWMLSHIVLGALLVMTLRQRCTCPDIPPAHPVHRHDAAKTYDYPL